MAEPDPEPSPEAPVSEFEGTFTETQVVPVTAEEELTADNVAAEGTAEEQAPAEDPPAARRQYTYQLEPDVSVKPAKITAAAKRVLDEYLRDMEGYSADEMRAAALQMSSAIREEVRHMGLDRYRIVCQLTIGERCDQDVASTFLCLWRHEFDHYATATYEGPGFFATATVFVVYKQ